MRWQLGRSWLAIGLVAGAFGAGAAAAPSRYHIDQRYGTIAFSITSLGLFTTEGRFARFEGDLLLDPDHPEQTRVDVRIDATSVEMPLENEQELLRSPAYFDTVRHPTEHFVSTSVEALAPARYHVHGTLDLRGVSGPLDLEAVVKDRHFDAARKVDVADFDVTGRLRRSAFGMRADQVMVSDVVRLFIHVHITVPVAAPTG